VAADVNVDKIYSHKGQLILRSVAKAPGGDLS
jgi:hypothetical protein